MKQLDKLQAIVIRKLILMIVILVAGCQRSMPENVTVIGQHDSYAFPAWSPNGTQIVYRNQDSVIVLDTTNQEKMALAIDTGEMRGPFNMSWIDDTTMAYVLETDNDSTSFQNTLALFDLDLNQQEEILAIEGKIYEFCWFPEREQFLLLMWEPHDIMVERYFRERSVVPVHGNSIRSFDPQHDTWSEIFNSGIDQTIQNFACDLQREQVAFVTREGDNTKHSDSLLNLSLATAEVETLYTTTSMGIDYPTWSPDGSHLALRTLRHNTRRPFRGIAIISLETLEIQSIMEPNYSVLPVDLKWAPSGNKLLIRSLGGSGKYSLVLLELDPDLIQEQNLNPE